MTATIRLGNGDGTFGSAVRYSTEPFESLAIALADLNGDGYYDLMTAGVDDSTNGYGNIRLGNGDGTFGDNITFSTEGDISYGLAVGDLNGDGVADIVTAGYDDLDNGYASIRLSQTVAGVGALQPFSLKSKSEAFQAMGLLDNALNNLSKQRGEIGAYQSRLSIAIGSIQSTRENFSAAEPRIRDADIASEAANLVRTQILQQAAASVLAQANQAPQLALTSLR